MSAPYPTGSVDRGAQQKLMQMVKWWQTSMASAILHALVECFWGRQMLVELAHWDQAKSPRPLWTTAAANKMIVAGQGVFWECHLISVFRLGLFGSITKIWDTFKQCKQVS